MCELKKYPIILVSLIMIVSLWGCSYGEVTETNIQQALEVAITETAKEEIAHYQNMHKSFYSYYLPQHVGKRNSTAYSNLFVIDNHEVLMSVKPASVIIDKYYGKTNLANSINEYDNALLSNSYDLINYEEKKISLVVSVFHFEGLYYMLVDTTNFSFLTSTPLGNMPSIIRDVIRIARSADVNETAILAEYSRKESIDYQQATTIFSQSIPENGTLAEMMENYFPNYDFSVDSQDFSQEEEPNVEDYAHDTEE